MDSSLRNTPALLTQIDKLTSQLVTRFLSIVELASVPAASNHDDDADNELGSEKQPMRADLGRTAANTLKMDVETAGLVRAAEELLTLTRQMKETWLFGKLDTLRVSAEEQARADKVEADARAVAEAVGRLTAPANTTA